MLVRALILCCLVLIGATVPAAAGSWPRAEGEAFLSVSATQDINGAQDDPLAGVYFEYGLRHTITVSGAVTYDFSTQQATEYELTARWHFPENDQPLRKALSLTLAGPLDDPRIEPAVHLGRGFSTPLGSGWADLALYASLSTEGRETEYGGYGVIGLKPHDRLMTMLGVDVMMTPDQTFVKAIPSVAWQLREGRHLTAQFTKGFLDAEDSEFGLGLWLQF